MSQSSRKRNRDRLADKPLAHPTVVGKRDDGLLVIAIARNPAGELLVKVEESTEDVSMDDSLTLEQLTRFSPEGWTFNEEKIQSLEEG